MQEARNIFNNGMVAFQNKDYYGCIKQLSRIEKIMGVDTLPTAKAGGLLGGEDKYFVL